MSIKLTSLENWEPEMICGQLADPSEIYFPEFDIRANSLFLIYFWHMGISKFYFQHHYEKNKEIVEKW